MLLKNKRTGEIIDFDAILPVKDVAGDSVAHLEYGSLAELEREWEDAPEEPKEYWCIRENGVVDKRPYPIIIECVEQENRDAMREIGNYFETEEEAELAVRKLKAWKRLKDKGFRFDKWTNVSAGPYMPIWFYFEEDTVLEDVKSDLDLLFPGGEE